jgi:hypothetical protein
VRQRRQRRQRRDALLGPRAEMGEGRGAADHDHAHHQRGEPPGVDRQLPRRVLDPVAEHDHAQQYSDHRLAGRDGRQRDVERAGTERALHQHDAQRTRADERVGRPVQEEAAEPEVTLGLQRLPGQGVLDAEDQPGGGPGQYRPRPAGVPAPGLNADERDERDRGGGRPVRERAERQSDRLGRPRYRQQRHPAAEHHRACDLPESERRLCDRNRHQQREDEVGGEQRLDERQRQVTDRPCRQDLAGDHAADAEEPAGLVEQVEDQPQRQEARVGLGLRRVLLQHETGADEKRGEQGEPIVEAGLNVHGTLPDTPVTALMQLTTITIQPAGRVSCGACRIAGSSSGGAARSGDGVRSRCSSLPRTQSRSDPRRIA